MRRMLLSWAHLTLLVCLTLCTLALQDNTSERRSTPFVEGAPVLKDFTSIVEDAMGCATCKLLVANAVNQVQAFLQFHNKSEIHRDEVEDVMQNVCDPHLADGAWMRQLVLHIVPDDRGNVSSAVHVEIELLNGTYTKCKRTCSTVQHACTHLISYPIFDTFGRAVERLSRRGVLSPNATVNRLLEKKFCQPYVACLYHHSYNNTLKVLLNREQATERGDIEGEQVEIVEPEAYTTEFPLGSYKSKLFPGYSTAELLQVYAQVSNTTRRAEAVEIPLPSFLSEFPSEGDL